MEPLNRPRIGVTACFFHPDPTRDIFKGKTLLYVEQSMIHWLMRRGAMPMLLPTSHAGVGERELVREVDGLILHGGDDVAPESYGERPQRPEWGGDRIRDVYEIKLIEACLDATKPILGICRGIQVLNVALGGTLHQDIATDRPAALLHRDRGIYDRLVHDIELTEGCYLHRLYGRRRGRVNSVHHQAIRELGRRLEVEARCPDDGVIEGVRLAGDDFVVGIQWHPEFQDPDPGVDGLLDPHALIDDFLAAAGRRRRHTA